MTSDLFDQPTASATKRSPSSASRLDENGNLPYSIPLNLVVQDRDVIRALVEYAEGDERDQYALEALKIGVLALRHVGGAATADLIQREVRNMQQTLDQHNRTVHSATAATLKEYFDPQDGRFSQRVQGLVAQDGELAQLIRMHIDGENSLFARTLLAHVGRDSPLMKQLDPRQSEGLLSVLKQTVETQLSQQRDQVLKEFSLDNKDGALTRLVGELTIKHGDLTNVLRDKIDEVVKEFSLDKPDSALSRLVANVTRAQQTITNEFSLDNKDSALARLKGELMGILEAHVRTNAEFQEEVKGALRELTARRQEQARSTLHGATFQSAVFQFLAHQSQSRGDVAEFTADRVGSIKNCKVGDAVVELGPETSAPGARIAFEAKEERGYTVKQALDELDTARKNRAAQVGVFVFSKQTAATELPPLGRFRHDIVVCWDAEDELTDSFLWAALELARLMCIHSQRKCDSQAADFAAIEEAIHDIEKHAKNLDEVQTYAETIQSASGKILKRLAIDREAFKKQVGLLRDKIGDLRDVIDSSQ